MEDLKNNLKIYLEKKKYHNMVTNPVHLLRIFPKLNGFINKDLNFSGQLYCFINDITYPKCNICGEYHTFVSFKKGFLKYCSKKCQINLLIYDDKNYMRTSCNSPVLICEKHNQYVSQKFFYIAQINKCECLCEKCSEEIILKNEFNEKIANKTKEFFIKISDNKKFLTKEYIKRYYPHFYLMVNNVNNILEKDFKNKMLYLLFNYNLKCSNENCNNLISIRKFKNNIKICNKCGYESYKYKEVRNLFSIDYWFNYIKKYFYNNLTSENQIIIENNNLIINNYCKHGNLNISKKHIKNLKRRKIYSLCLDCNKDYYKENFNNVNIDLFKKNWNLLKTISYERFLYYNPNMWGLINKHMNDHNASFQESKFMLKYDIIERPKCFVCKKDSVFSSDAYDYLATCGNHHHALNTSVKENEFKNFVKSLGIDFIENDRKIIKKELDIYIPDKKLAFELNGVYYHSELFNKEESDKYKHYNKWKLCKESGIKLITIWEDEWDYKKNIVKSIIKNNLKLSDIKIYARNTIIKNVNNDEKTNFLIKNHLQGNIPSHINIGLYYNKNLVFIMCFGKQRMITNSATNKVNEYELLRCCSELNTNVIGGASKVFKHFINNYKPIKIKSFASCDLSDGSLYKILGFKEVKHTGLNYWWVKGNVKYHRSNFMKYKLVKQGFDKNKTAEEIMRKRGFHYISGTGNLKYEWYKEDK